MGQEKEKKLRARILTLLLLYSSIFIFKCSFALFVKVGYVILNAFLS